MIVQFDSLNFVSFKLLSQSFSLLKDVSLPNEIDVKISLVANFETPVSDDNLVKVIYSLAIDSFEVNGDSTGEFDESTKVSSSSSEFSTLYKVTGEVFQELKKSDSDQDKGVRDKFNRWSTQLAYPLMSKHINELYRAADMPMIQMPFFIPPDV